MIKDLTGSTTALAATYRYRADPVQPRIRLIGMDVPLYSRTYAHDGSETNWNVRTGDTVTSLLKVASGAGYENCTREDSSGQ